MKEEETIINKVAESSLVNIDLEDYYPKGKRIQIDLAETLFQGLILREKDFREWVKTHDWSQYKDAFVAVTCSADAIIPVWAYMLVSAQLEPEAKHTEFGDLEALETSLYSRIIEQLEIDAWRDQRLIIKGCGNLPVPRSAYLMLTTKLRPIAKSIMYGEACSTVPIYKK
ncbi:MAG: DUF2480 family protein [Bacteroidia bacterium]